MASGQRNVRVGRDWTIYSIINGKVMFDQEGRRINVVPVARLLKVVCRRRDWLSVVG